MAAAGVIACQGAFDGDLYGIGFVDGRAQTKIDVVAADDDDDAMVGSTLECGASVSTTDLMLHAFGLSSSWTLFFRRLETRDFRVVPAFPPLPFALRLQHTVVHCVIGLKILNELVNEMNQRTKKRSMTQHRKVATSFRDLSLLQTFEIAITLLNQVWIDCGESAVASFNWHIRGWPELL